MRLFDPGGRIVRPSRGAGGGRTATAALVAMGRSLSGRRAPPAIYPARGQDARQLARDRFECYGWAVQQSGFDPARSLVRLPQPAVRVEADPPAGVGTAAGVLTGAAIGAAVSGRHHSGEAAAVGAVLGGIVGAASDSARAAEARRIESELNRQAARDNMLDARGQAYQRAFAACLEGRGYTVK